MRLRLAGGGLADGVAALVTAVVEGDACVFVGSVLSLAADERVTLCDIGKPFARKGYTSQQAGVAARASLVDDDDADTDGDEEKQEED